MVIHGITPSVLKKTGWVLALLDNISVVLGELLEKPHVPSCHSRPVCQKHIGGKATPEHLTFQTRIGLCRSAGAQFVFLFAFII